MWSSDSSLMKKASRCSMNGDSDAARELASDAPGEAVAVFASDDHEGAGRGEGTADAGDPVAPAGVDDQVVPPPTVVDVLAGVVDDVVRAHGPDRIELAGAGDAGHGGAQGLGELDREGADAAGRADHEHVLAWLDPTDLGQRLERGDARDRRDRGLFEGDVPGLVDQFRFLRCGELGERAVADAEHRVADGEAGHVTADLDDPTGDVHAWHRVLGLGQP